MPTLDVNTHTLNLNKVPKIVGTEQKAKLALLYMMLEENDVPLYLTGDSGSGKTALGQRLAKEWSQRNSVPAYYVKVSQDDTKTSLMLGFQLVDGSTKLVDGLLAKAARQKAFVFIDELTHSTTDLILSLNAFDGAESVITVGEESIDATGMKIIYGSNLSSHAGNIRLPQSFANRVLPIPFDYPNAADEYEISMEVIRKSLVVHRLMPVVDSRGNKVVRDGVEVKEYKNVQTPLRVPEPVIKYIVSLIRDLRGSKEIDMGSYPLSVRNVSKTILYLNTMARIARPKGVDDYFTKGSNQESTRRRINKRILDRDVDDSSALTTGPAADFIGFVSTIGVEQFRNAVLSGLNYYSDTEGYDIGEQAIKQQLYASVV